MVHGTVWPGAEAAAAISGVSAERKGKALAIHVYPADLTAKSKPWERFSPRVHDPHLQDPWCGPGAFAPAHRPFGPNTRARDLPR